MPGLSSATALLNRPAVPIPALLGLDKRTPTAEVVDKFFFSSPLLSRRLAVLNQLVRGPSPVILVIGERGSGKTTLLNRLVADAALPWQPGRIRIKSSRNHGMRPGGNLDNRMVFISRSDGPPSVIVDDAHQLTPSELSLLLKAVAPSGGRPRIANLVLFAETSMRQRMTEITGQLPARAVVEKIFMSPLDEAQTVAYLHHRFKTAGFLQKFPFTRRQLKQIHAASGGLPGWINGEAFVLLHKMYRCRRPSQAAGRHRTTGAVICWKLRVLARLLGFSKN